MPGYFSKASVNMLRKAGQILSREFVRTELILGSEGMGVLGRDRKSVV